MERKNSLEESDLVICTVTKIYPHSVFVTMDDFGDRQGMIHISEIAPGRIRNIHDYVKIGKKVICKILSINREKGHIDLSLRRVSEGQKREKADIIKREQKAEKIVEFVADKLKVDRRKLYDEIFAKVPNDYACLHDFFEEFITDESILKKLNLQKSVYDMFAEVIRQRIKPPEVEVEADIKLKTYSADGVNRIKSILRLIEMPKATIRYKGGGSYSISIIDDNFKDAEKKLEKVNEIIEKEAKKGDCEYTFTRVEKKQKAAAA
jgi:translation initiation factor 2 subunit 1